MRNGFLFLAFCSTISAFGQINIIQTDSKATFRALSVVDDRVAWLAGTQGTVGRSLSGGKSWKFQTVPGFENSDFRSLYAFDSLRAVIANAGSPAVVLITENGGKSWKEVYLNNHKDAFLDGIDFRDENQGMIYGDPVNGRLLLLRTSDAGRTWFEVPENRRPDPDSGEASFAASGSNIRLWDRQKIAIATGGVKSRIWYSEDDGKSWKIVSVPILQGSDSRGIFSLHIDGKRWMVAGGDYKTDTLKKDHIYVTADEGKTWIFPEKPTRGYRECITGTGKDTFVATGPSGLDFSQDGGKNWQPLSDLKGFHVGRMARKGKLIILAGSKGLIGIFE